MAFSGIYAGRLISYVHTKRRHGDIQEFRRHFLGVTWSLGVEEQFYLLMPFLLLAFPRKQWVGMVFVLTLAAVVLRPLFPGVHAFVNTPFRMDSLFAGVLTAALVRNQQIRAYLEERRWLLRSAFIMLSIGFMSVALNGSVDVLNDRVSTLFNVYLALDYAVLVLLAVLESGRGFTAMFRNPILRYLGLISYGLYLYHEAVLGLLHGFIRRSSPSLTTDLGWLVNCSLCLYLLVPPPHPIFCSSAIFSAWDNYAHIENAWAHTLRQRLRAFPARLTERTSGLLCTGRGGFSLVLGWLR